MGARITEPLQSDLERWRQSRVLVVGVGGLGCPAASLLARCGVGHLTLVDPDVVEISNLHRQPLFRDSDLGQPKAGVAATRLRELFPHLVVKGLAMALDENNSAELLPNHDIVLDATDRIETKLWLNDQCVRHLVPLVHAGALGWQGQLCSILPGRSACLRCVFDDLEPDLSRSSCRDAGIVGPVVGYLGSRQACEALAYLAGRCERLITDRLLLLDVRRPSLRTVRTRRDLSCPACGSLASGALPRS